MAARLRLLACNDTYAPYVAQGLIGFDRLKNVGDRYLPDVAKTLLDTAEGRTTNCRGAKGLNAASIAKLRKWAAKAQNKSKQMAK